MTDYKSTQEVINCIYTFYYKGNKKDQHHMLINALLLSIEKAIKELPSADVMEHKKAFWLKVKDGVYTCPLCVRSTIKSGEKHPLEMGLDYCPWCSADMRVKGGDMIPWWSGGVEAEEGHIIG